MYRLQITVIGCQNKLYFFYFIVSINGTNLFGYGLNITQVRIGTAIAEILYEDTSNSSINVRATSLEVTETTPVDVTLISDTNAIVMSADQPFSYLKEGQVNNISPDIGQIGTMVNITGINLLGGGTNINTILLDGVIPSAISIYSNSSIVITLGDDAMSDPNFYPGQVYIESDTGATVIGGIFSHKPPGNITSVEPTVGRRGTTITLNGYNLTGFGNYIESVFIGDYNVSDAMMSLETTEGDTSLIVVAPDAPGGHSGPIKLIIDTGATIVSTQSFTFVQSGSITNVTPNIGAEGRGVLIQGLNLIISSLDITSLTIGGSEVTRIVTESSSQISIIAGQSPNGTLNNLPITVTLSDGSFIEGGAFTYEEYEVSILGTNEGQFGTNVILKVSFPVDSILCVKFDDIEADILQIDSQNSTVTVEVPRAKIPGNYTVDVTVENTDNIIARLSAGFTYLTEGFICTVSPSEGQRGTRVRIAGENLLGGGNNVTELKFGLVSATVHSYSNNEINASLSDNNDDYPVTVDITIVSDTGAIITFTDGFTIITPGNIGSVTPSSGQYGTLVTITGMGLLEGDKDLVSVTLTGTDAVVIGTPNDTTIVVSAGASNFSIIGFVSIITSTGAEIVSNQSNQFQYLMPGIVNSVSPTNGSQGTIVTITGQDMLNGGSLASIVTLGEITAEIIESNDTLITVLAGTGGNGTAPAGDIIITSNTGSIVTHSSAWTYTELGNISSFSPSSGQQGVIVMIEGDGLLADQEDDIMYIELAGIMATVIEKTSTKIVVEAGYSSTSQSGLIVVKLVSGPVITSLTNWTYYAASLDFVSLSNGINGTYVTLTGINIVGESNTAYDVSTVTFGGIPCYDIQTISQDSVRVRAGFSDNTTQQSDVRITSTSGAYLVLKEAWNYLPNGDIVTLEPATATPGDNVTITGTNLVPSTTSSLTVTVGKTVSFSAYIVNSSVIIFRVGLYSVPDQPGTNVPVHIVADDGATVISDNDMFSFISTFLAESVTPYAGQAGTVVVINGSNLFDEDNEPFEVYLAGIQADILYYTNNTMTVRTGDGPVEGISGSVTVVNGNGTFIGLGGIAWTYLPVLSTNHVTPLSGRNGSLVTIDTTSVQAMFVLQSVYLGDQEATVLANNGGIIQVSVGEFENSSSIENITLYYEDGVSLVIMDSWNYQPSITINDTSSILQGYYNSIVTIYGDGFNGGNANVLVSSVTLAGFNTDIVSQTDVSLVVQITDNYDSSGAAIIGSIIITSVDGARYDSKFTENITFTYVQVKIDTVSPVQGQNGTRVTLTGIGLLAGANSIASVMLAGIEAETINVASDTLITVSAGGYYNATGSENIEYTVNTGAMVTIANSWSYISLGEIITVTPTNGSKGTVVNILGDGLLGGGVKAEVVFLNGVEALEVLVSNDKIVQVRAGDSDPKMAGEVTIISNTGAILSSTINNDLSFEYIAAPGTIDTIMPMAGQFGTKVTIIGIDLHKGEGISSVTIAGVEATILKYNSTEVEVIVQRPPITSSFSGLVVIESDYRSLIESANNFTYLREGDITSIVPSQGQRGTRVTIKGNRLYGGGSTITSVVMAGIMANISSLSDSEIQVEIKENTDSLTEDVNGDILLISNSGAQVSLIDSWTYIQVGVISSVMPESGQYGTRVTITGDRLTAGGNSVQNVIIGDTDSYAVVSSNDNEVVFRVGEPDGLSAFAGLIKLVSDDYGEIESQVYWNYTASSVINDVSPANGTGGTVIVITGINLLGGIGLNVTKIEIVGISVNLILSQNDTAIEVEVGFNPDGQEKEGDIVIETDSGSISYLQNGWVYLSECPIGQFGNNTNSCSVCNIECDHCYGPTEYECYSCKNFEIVTGLQSQCVAKCPGLSTTDKVCVDACGTDQFQQTRLDNNTYCVDCHQQCDPNLSCFGEEASQCTDCLNVALNGVCIETCPVGHFVGNESECISCNDECQLEAGCRGPEPHECNKCLNVTIFKLDQQIDECIPVCPSGYYTNSTGYCQLCHPQCNGGCDGPLSFDCYECKNAILIDSLENEQCIEECTDNLDYNIYYLNSTGYCDRCHIYCSTTAGCTGPLESDCIACLNFTGNNSDKNEFFPKLNEQCVRECPTIEYYVDLRSGECLDCHESCTFGCSGPTANDCIIDDVTTNSTTEETSSLFKAGVGTIGLVVGLFVVLFIIMLIVIVVLACKLKGRDDSKSYSFAGNGEHTIIPMHSTTSFNRTDSSVVPTRPFDYVTPRISNINPIFGNSSYMEARQTEPTGVNQPSTMIEENTDQMTSEDFYMDMEFEYKKSLNSKNGGTKQNTSAVPPPILPKLDQSSNGGPPIPAKRSSNKLSTGSYKPPPPLPTEELTMIDDSTIDELLTQDEYEGFTLPNLPPPPQLPPSVTIAATSTSNNTIGNIYDFTNENEEAVYEETDSCLVPTVKYSDIKHDLPHLPASISMPEVPPPTIPARQTSRTSVKSSGRSNNVH